MAGPPREIGRFEVVRELGRGGMGVVYEARDPRSGERVALKVILDPDVASEESLARFRREADVAARVRAPGLVACREVGSWQGRPFLVLDFVPGESLEALARRGVDPRRAAAIARDVARALAALHGAGVFHRDVKPENVLVGANGEPRLVDLGLARSDRAERLTRTGQVVGTPRYMAPEQADADRGAEGPATDVYALGAVLHRLLAGEPPFVAATPAALMKKILMEAPPAIGGAPPALAALVRRCLAKNPLERPTASSVAEELDRFLEGGAKSAAPASRVPLVVGVVAMLAALAALAAVVVGPSRSAPVAPPAPPPPAPSQPAKPLVAEPPLDAAGLEERARAHGERGELDAMVADLTKALAAKSDDWQLRFERAVALDAAGDLRRAGEDVVEIFAKHMGRPEGQLASAFAKAVKLRHERGIASIVTRLDAAQLLSVAREIDREKPLPEADAYAEAAVLFAPDDVDVLIGCADIECRGDGFPAAGMHIAHALELAPEKGAVWFERGVFLERSQDWKGAVEAYTRSLSIAPTASGYARRALMRSNIGDDAGALDDYGEAIDLYPKRSIWYTLRAAILEKRGDKAGAAADRQRAAELDAGR